jgi:hypothetical protein
MANAEIYLSIQPAVYVFEDELAENVQLPYPFLRLSRRA